MRLAEADKAAIEMQVAAFERATGAQAIVSVVDRCDSYPEVPWRVFALGTVVAAMIVWAVPVSGAVLYHSTALLLMAVLGAGVTAAIAVILLPAGGRWLLPRERRETEVRQYAQAMFLTRELFTTRDRSALLILIGLYERHAVILADSGARKRLPAEQPKSAERALNQALQDGALADAVLAALASLKRALGDTGIAPAGNEIADRVIRERGH
jgi:uncharacterized membrane protein